MDPDYTHLLSPVLDLAEETSLCLMHYYAEKTLCVNAKADQSPVTAADLAASRLIEQGLLKIAPYPVLSEEGFIPPFAERLHWQTYWLVDPLDGTRDFINHTGDFSINIALIHQNRPVLGVIAAPVSGGLYWALHSGPAYQRLIGESAKLLLPSPIVNPLNKPTDHSGIKVVVSRTFNQDEPRWRALYARLAPIEYLFRGSALKMLMIASQEADLYPRFGLSREWDTAAGHCIVIAAGGHFVDLQGTTLRYNEVPDLATPPFFAFYKSYLTAIICG